MKKFHLAGLLVLFIALEFTSTLLSDVLRIVIERYQAGARKYLDVIRANVEVTRLRNDLVEAKREQQMRHSGLNVLLGRAGNTPIVLLGCRAASKYFIYSINR